MSRYIQAPDGVPISFEMVGPEHAGTGIPALVLVHGWSCDRTYWRCQIPHFAQKQVVVAIDLAGHGKSGMARSAWTMEAFGRDVAAVVEHLELERVILMGHSMGGPVIVEAAQQLDGQTAALIGVETFKNLDQARTDAEIESSLAVFQEDFVPAARRFIRAGQFTDESDPALVAEIVEDMASAPAQVAIGAYAELQRHQSAVQQALTKIEAPKALINADYRRMNQTAAERLGFRVEIMTGVSHFLMREQPDQFNALVDSLLLDLLA